MEENILIHRFMDLGVQLSEGALKYIMSQSDPEATAYLVISKLSKMEKRPFLITTDAISAILMESMEETQVLHEDQTRPSEIIKKSVHTKFRPVAAEYESKVSVRRDITGKSYSEGDIRDFWSLFSDRYDRVSRLLRNRVELREAVPMETLSSMGEREKVSVIGMVADRRESSAGNIIIDLEDPTGRALALVFKGKKDLVSKAMDVVTDEVIGVVGSLRPGDRIPRIFVTDIVWPDLPVKHELGRSEDPVCAALISDLHVGSEMFLEDVFMKFMKWLNEGADGKAEAELAGKVKYLVVAGDIVDGIGVYPGQEGELLVDDIFKQYEIAAKLLAEVPDYITVIVTPGNHDAVRPSEPQPAIPKDIAGDFYERGFLMAGNPVLANIHGVNFIVYHGRSVDDMVGAVPGLDRKDSVKPFVKLLQKRHLAPIYGGRTAISPERADYMVIDEVPDVLHCGHVHVNGYSKYREVSIVNSGTFQSKTLYMQKLGVEPTPGMVPIFDLQTHQVRVVRFA
ncbi:MAG: DNA-directed DNA polymerase II small subunit [Candidatus Hadarchaeales archaeon]